MTTFRVLNLSDPPVSTQICRGFPPADFLSFEDLLQREIALGLPSCRSDHPLSMCLYICI